MTRKQFNRDYMVRVRRTKDVRENRLVGYDALADILGYKFVQVLDMVERACACKVVIKPFHGVEITFIAH